MMFMAITAMAQTNPIDFEPAGNGASWTWNVFEMGAQPLQFVANPDTSGINTSSTATVFTAQQTNTFYTGCVTNNIAPFTLNASNSTVKIMVYKTVISNVGIKFEAAAASTGELLVANTLINQWEELTFDFSSKIGEPSSTNIDGIAIFPDYDNARAQDNVVYFDNITFGAQASSGNDPMVAAPDPTLPQSQVISMFSGVYNDVPVDTWNTAWSSATYSEVMVAGNPTKKYENLDFNGIETVASSIDATAANMLYLNMDVWNANSTTFRVKLVDFGGDGYQGANADTEAELLFTPALNQWETISIPLADFTAAGMTSFSDINQMIISSLPTGISKIYIDNIYFSTMSPLSNDDTALNPFTVFPNPSSDVWNVRTENRPITQAILYTLAGKKLMEFQPNANSLSISNQSLASGMYILTLNTANDTQSLQVIKE